ncbi:MAG: ArsC family transcriptional regulator [Spirochaetae bacterium HGW-Spirochaetae-3]|jgi:arsenate reductase-like glutaredoxin family protein|nr:MAG: ArsC family transcriptional regulator [Spirochaetae bacterium HGW-Spirochaetae-3]
MALQIFGTRKCQATRKAERFFKDRDVGYHFVDLAEKGISSGELDAIARAVGLDSLVDEESRYYKDRGLAYMDYDPKEEILAHPLLLRTPIVREGPRASAGDRPDDWMEFAKAERS